MPWLIGLVFALAATVASAGRLTTFAWDAGANWPPGTTVELCGNGNVCLSGITGTQATLDLPVNPGELIQGQARAVAPAGYQCGNPPTPCPYSEWATVAQTWPAVPAGVWARYEQGVIPMAIAFVNANASNNQLLGTTISSAALATTTGNAIFVAVSAYGGANGVVTGVTDTAGNTYTRAGSEEGGDANHKVSTWYALNITGHASNVVTVTYAGSTGYRCISVAQFSGIATSDAYDQASTIYLTPTGTTHTSNNTGTTTQNDELVIGNYIAWSTAYTLTATAPTVIAAQTSGGNNAIAYKIVSSTGTQSTTLTTATSTSYAVQARTFKAAVAGGATALPRRALDGPFYGALQGSVR